jgi:hypothetical protein
LSKFAFEKASGNKKKEKDSNRNSRFINLEIIFCKEKYFFITSSHKANKFNKKRLESRAAIKARNPIKCGILYSNFNVMFPFTGPSTHFACD